MQFPNFIGRQSFDMESVRVVVSSESRNLKTLTRSLTGQRFDVKMRCFVKPWDTLKAAGWLEAMQQDGASFTYTDETWIEQQAGITNKTAAAASSGATVLTLNSVAGLFVGALCNIGGQSKLYRVLAIAGNTVTLNTGIKNAISNNTAVVFSEPKITLELAPDLKRGGEVSQGLTRQLALINLRLIEVI